MIIKLGPGVTSFSIGDKVFELESPNHSPADKVGFAKTCSAGFGVAAKTPKGFSVDDVVTFPVSATTSFAALFNEKGFRIIAPFPGSEHKKADDGGKEILLVIGGNS
jgi:NADPH:quinone reductase